MKISKDMPAPAGVSLPPAALMTVGECDRPPGERGWLHEIKNDGWRLALLTDGKGGLRLQTKKATDRTWDFLSPVRALAGCGHAMILDGEIAVPDEQGVTRLAALHNAMRHGEPDLLAYYAFDILELDGEDLRSEPIEKRKGRLVMLGNDLRRRLDLPRFMTVDGIISYGPDVFARAGRLGAEGIVSKKLGSPYRGGDKPSPDWVKSVFEKRVT